MQKCFYLQVNHFYNWKQISIGEGLFDFNNYRLCYCSDDLDDLNKLCQQIERIFDEVHGSWNENGKRCYSLFCPSKTNILYSYCCEIVGENAVREQLKEYPYNCFKNKADAERALSSIRQILGIPMPSKEYSISKIEEI